MPASVYCFRKGRRRDSSKDRVWPRQVSQLCLLFYACITIASMEPFVQYGHSHSSLINIQWGCFTILSSKAQCYPTPDSAFKFLPEMPPKSEKTPLVWRGNPKEAYSSRKFFWNPTPFIWEILVTSEFYFIAHLLHNKNNISLACCLKSNARKICQLFHVEFSTAW